MPPRLQPTQAALDQRGFSSFKEGLKPATPFLPLINLYQSFFGTLNKSVGSKAINLLVEIHIMFIWHSDHSEHINLS